MKKTPLLKARHRYFKSEKQLKSAIGTDQEKSAIMRRLMQARNYLKAQQRAGKVDPDFSSYVSDLNNNTAKAKFKREASDAKSGKSSSVCFYRSRPWRELRYKVLKKEGRRCQCCGATPEHGIVLHVDHIKPRSTHPDLSLDESNLQVLCGDCNLGKGNRDKIDYRESTRIAKLEMKIAERDEYIEELMDTIASLEMGKI